MNAYGTTSGPTARASGVSLPRWCRHLCLLLPLAALLCGDASARAATDAAFAAQIRAAQRHAAARVMATERTTPPGRYPYFSEGTAWSLSRATGWTSGYAAGQLWLIYQMSADRWWRLRAQSRGAAIGAAPISPAVSGPRRPLLPESRAGLPPDGRP